MERVRDQDITSRRWSVCATKASRRGDRACARTRRSLRGERGVTLDVEVRLELLERLVAEALHAAQIRGALEPAVLLAPVHDPLVLRWPYRRQHHEQILG